MGFGISHNTTFDYDIFYTLLHQLHSFRYPTHCMAILLCICTEAENYIKAEESISQGWKDSYSRSIIIIPSLGVVHSIDILSNYMDRLLSSQ